MDSISYIVNVEAAIYKNDKWLIIKRSEKEEHAPGLLAFVGGKVETNKKTNNILEDTLIREVWEEIDIQISKTMHYIESKLFISDKGQAVIDIVFICKYESGTPKCMSSEEVSEIHWMNCREVLESKVAPIWLKESIEKAESLRLKIEGKEGENGED